MEEIHTRIGKKFRRSVRKIDTTFPITGGFASDIVNRFQDVVEGELKLIASQFNHFGLLIALHHIIPPFPLLPVHSHFIGDAQQKFVLAILAAMKYSAVSNHKYSFTPEEYTHEPGTLLGFIKKPEIIKNVFAFEEAVNLLFEGQKQLRLVEKGAHLKVDFTKRMFIRAIPSEYLKKASHEFDDRSIKETKRNFLSELGGYSPLIPLRNSLIGIPLVQINWRKVENLKSIPHLTFWIDAIPVYGSLFLLRSELQSKFNNEVHIEDIIAFILCSFRTLQQNDENVYPYGLGYDFTTKERFLKYISAYAPQTYTNLLNQSWKDFGDTNGPIIILESLTSKWWEKKGVDIFDFISLNENDAGKINLRTLSPVSYLLNIETQDVVFLAFNTTVNFLKNLWRPIKKGGSFGKLKGDDFQIGVNNRLIGLPGVEQIWKIGKKLHTDGSKKETDIDVCVGKDEFLFAISCKAYYLNEKYIEGSGQEYYGRWQQCKGWLKEIDEIGKHITKNSKDLTLPRRYKYLLPIVCTSHPEYIWDEIRNLRLPNNVPRICTLGEILDFIRDLNKYRPKLIRSPYKDFELMLQKVMNL
ncbi:MAG: hypothetical protein ACOYT7_03185 [Patescibacteria group bacterium]